MANNVTNIIELRGKPERVQELLEAIANEEYGSGSISFEKIIPMPGNLYMGAIPRDGTQPYGKNNWLDWSRANWGPKWDAYGFDNRPKDTTPTFTSSTNRSAKRFTAYKLKAKKWQGRSHSVPCLFLFPGKM